MLLAGPLYPEKTLDTPAQAARPVYRPCVLCGRKHRMRPNGSSKTADILKEEKVMLKGIGQFGEWVRLPAGAVICFISCRPPSRRRGGAREGAGAKP